ncbi:MAG: sensor histidine kinase [bacterium]|nr:sensor histidine kinase [bacterium]
MATFKTRARALDMLGRQQIAGIPNAISELFKNAHDAYADNIRVDFFRSDQLLVLRDDGFGMTHEEFEERWLTLGTESKLKGSDEDGFLPIEVPKDKIRAICGEKGIGRLSIAAIGPQVLILSKAKRKNRINPLVACFINWTMFTIPGIDLSEIVIPIREFSKDQLPGNSDVKGMVNEVVKNLKSIYKNKKYPEDIYNIIHKELKEFNLDIEESYDYLGVPSLKENNTGTHFYILPTDEMFINELIPEDNNSVSPIKKTLLGFNNTINPKKNQPDVKLTFFDFETDTNYKDIIAEEEFFTSDDFEAADHVIDGKFDKFGTFHGDISIFGKKIKGHTVPWRKSEEGETLCGPFLLKFGYVQGMPRDTHVELDKHGEIVRKTNRIGGLYIYRNGIRVLPYGDIDFDFLEIEKRRTLSAKYYFFSHRQMFGAIEIDSENNSRLVEKAGREGFRRNRAYIQFRSILIDFILQLTADFFREEGSGLKSDLWIEGRKENQRRYKAKQKREEESERALKAFGRKVSDFFSKYEKGKPKKQYDALYNDVKDRIDSIIESKKNISQWLSRYRSEAFNLINDLESSYKIERPHGFGLNPDLEKDWVYYNELFERLKEEVFGVYRKKITDLFYESEDIAKNAKSPEEIFEDNITHEIESSISKVDAEKESVSKDITASINNTEKLVQSIFNDYEKEIKKLTKKFESAKKKKADMTELEVLALGEIHIITEKYKEILARVNEKINDIKFTRDKEGYVISSLDVTEAQEHELYEFKERIDAELDLVQIGSAVSIIHHEFHTVGKAIRSNLKELKNWADINEKLFYLYSRLVDNFDHLDAFLALFTPLNKRKNLKKRLIKGSDVSKYIADVFVDSFEKDAIKLEKTNDFMNYKFEGFISSFYPVFLNIIDNAIFWLKEKKRNRIIRLHTEKNGDFIDLLISNNGPPVPLRSRNRIFERGYTIKPGGRGLGLFLTRQGLAKNGFDISLDEESYFKNGVTFRISKIEEE